MIDHRDGRGKHALFPERRRIVPYVSKEQIESAKQMDLLTYLKRYEPRELVHVGGDVYSTRVHDSLKISNGKWCWWSHRIGGRSALDYLIKVQGMDFTEAVMLLSSESPSTLHALNIQPRPAMPKRFELPAANEDNRRVTDYLRGRGIDASVISFCIETGRVYQSREYGNAVFVGFDAKGIPRYSTLRGASPKSSFKLDVSGSDKRHGFCLTTDRPNDSIHVFESAVDVLSYASLVKLSGRDWRGLNYLSLGGVFMPREDITETPLPLALEQYLKEHPDIHNIVLCLDNDEVGQQAAQAIIAILKDRYSVVNQPPARGKDYNDLLMMKRVGQISQDMAR